MFPPLDDLAPSEVKAKALSAIARAVELVSVDERTDVVHGHSVPRFGFRSLSSSERFDLRVLHGAGLYLHFRLEQLSQQGILLAEHQNFLTIDDDRSGSAFSWLSHEAAGRVGHFHEALLAGIRKMGC